jgi:catechol 2,3-dioxygenase-like lactoylglutathione lyase family enzyme
MRIGLTGIVVDDQDQAKQFYTKVLGFQVNASAPYGPNERWLSVVSPEESDGVQLVLHLADEPARAFQAAATAAAAAAVAEVEGNLFRQDGEYWTVVFDGSVVRLRDAKGLRYLARLLAHPGREFHATDLEAAEAQVAPAAPLGSRASGGEPELAVRADLGDAGVLLDATAKAAYRARLAELRTELEEAEGFNDPARAAKARQEMEFLVGELARAVGLGGRDRRAASHAERARLNVTRAIRAAVANLARDNPTLGRHLAATIRTGRYCAYLPDPRARSPGNAGPGHRPPA